MKKLVLLLILVIVLVAWAVHKSGAIEEKKILKYSEVPGGERTSREYRFNWDKLEKYLKSFIPG